LAAATQPRPSREGGAAERASTSSQGKLRSSPYAEGSSFIV
jgi:hypothetical protein